MPPVIWWYEACFCGVFGVLDVRALRQIFEAFSHVVAWTRLE